MLLSRQSSAHHKQVSGASVKNKNLSGWQVVSARRTAVSTLRVVCFKRRTARAQCVPRISYVSVSRSHTQSPLLSPPRQACLRHASRAQARAPTALPLYRFLSNRLTRLSPLLVCLFGRQGKSDRAILLSAFYQVGRQKRR